MSHPFKSLIQLSLAMVVIAFACGETPADDLDLTLRHRVETAEKSGLYHAVTRQESWKPEQTAIIVCDMWDLHHCLNAVRREGEFAPRLEEVLNTAREQGVTIIHAPSNCMPFYEGHAARERAKAAPKSANLPEDIGQWCYKIPAEERGVYPVDQSDGGEDDDPAEHSKWAKQLESMDRNPKAPWKRQVDVLTIDAERDYITDQGDETWNILESRGIHNVILSGVHTNMCVLGRPFGLRQLARNGKNVVLMRDLTDTMYNPEAWPFVSHFTGTDLIIEHIEKFVCPTITSDQLIGGESFVFKNDDRPHVVFLIGEKEYRTNETLPKFAAEQLGQDYRVSFVHASAEEPNTFPGIDVVKDADVLFVSVRRRTPPAEQLKFVRDHVAAGKPVVGIRTASHAFTLRNQPAPEGLDAWPEFDAQVFGGNYSNHYGNELVATVKVIKKHADHAILKGVSHEEFTSDGSLYVVRPLAEGTTPLLMGRVEGHDPEPMAWAFQRKDGGRSFYSSLGYYDDFEAPAFVKLLKNAINWAADGKVTQTSAKVSANDASRGWVPVQIQPVVEPEPSNGEAAEGTTTVSATPTSDPRTLEDVTPGSPSRRASTPLATGEWFRCFLSMPELGDDEYVAVEIPGGYSAPHAGFRLWLNGQKMGQCDYAFGTVPNSVAKGLHTLVVQPSTHEERNHFLKNGVTVVVTDFDESAPEAEKWHKTRTSLRGTWQHRIGDDPSWIDVQLPAQYAAAADAIYAVAN